MRVAIGLIATALVALGAGTLVSAEETIPTVPFPDAYRAGSAPALKVPAGKPKVAGAPEKAAAVNGTLYAVIAPTYLGTNHTTSYIRLFNGGSANATISVIVVGTPSSSNRGTANYVLAPRQALQYGIDTVIAAANATMAPGDTGYALYLQSAEATAGYQHVTYNDLNFFFENVSVCANLLNQAIKPVAASVVLTSIHTTALPAYPSQIEIHNFWNAAVNYRATVIDAATGNVKGQFNIPITANTSYVAPFTFFQTAVNWVPTPTEYHANLVITDPSGAHPNVVLGQSIVNSQMSSTINMSTTCAINAPAASGDGGFGGGFGGGGISY